MFKTGGWLYRGRGLLPGPFLMAVNLCMTFSAKRDDVEMVFLIVTEVVMITGCLAIAMVAPKRFGSGYFPSSNRVRHHASGFTANLSLWRISVSAVNFAHEEFGVWRLPMFLGVLKSAWLAEFLQPVFSPLVSTKFAKRLYLFARTANLFRYNVPSHDANLQYRFTIG